MADDPVVVIGSGPCGAMAAATLAGRGVDVLVLDAGQRAPRGLVVRAAGNTLYRRMGWSQYSTDRQDPATDPGGRQRPRLRGELPAPGKREVVDDVHEEQRHR